MTTADTVANGVDLGQPVKVARPKVVLLYIKKLKIPSIIIFI